jgi:methionyl-tRNA formyltransferase
MSSERPRVVLVGLGPTTDTALSSLHGRFDVVGLVRDGEDEVTTRARALGVPVTADTSLEALREIVTDLAPDAVVVSSYHRIVPADLLSRCPFVNVHYAPLPRYRGRATVNWAIINGEPSVAISIHCLVAALDAGGVLYQEHLPIGLHDTVTDLYERLNEVQRRALADAVARRIAGDEGKPQEESEASYGCTRTPEDGEIAWSDPTIDVYRLIRALTAPFPGAYSYLGLRRLWIRRAEPVAEPDRFDGRVPGRVVGRSAGEGWVDVLTGDGVVRLHEVQVDGEPAARAADVIRSVKLTLGLRTADLLGRIAELEARLH